MSSHNIKRPYLSVLFVLANLLFAAGTSAGNAHAGTPAQVAPETRDGFSEFRPAGNAPANGGNVARGTKFTLEMWVNAGSNNNVTAVQNYLTFDHAVLQLVDPNGSACNPVAAAVPDTSQLDAVLQNEVCNGPGNCDFRGTTVGPGTISFSSGALSRPALGGQFRIASFTFCASNGGTARLRWEFAPPAPVTRDTEIILDDNNFGHDPTRYREYVINVSGATATPGPTNPPIPTPGGRCTMNFRDVPQSDPFYSDIEYVFCRNIVTGYNDGTFKTYDYTMRAQIAKMVKLGFNLPTNTSGGPHFSDVPANHPFYEYIETIYNLHIVTGFQGGVFKPWDNVKRGQVAKIVVLAAMEADSGSWQLVNPSTPSFRDVPRTDTFYQYVETAKTHDMISGFNDGTFRLYDLAKRGQIAKIIHGALEE